MADPDVLFDEYKQLGSMSVYVYVIFCFMFFLLKDSLFSSGQSPFVWIVTYIMCFFVVLLLMNVRVFSSPLVCDAPQFGNAVFVTLYPMIFIFAVTCMLIEVFPGWLRVFSNTFGMSIANMFGMKKIVSDIFTESRKQYIIQSKSKSGDMGQEETYQFIKTVDMIYNDPTPMINEMTLDIIEEPIRVRADGSETNQALMEEFNNLDAPMKTEMVDGVQYAVKIKEAWGSWEMLKSKSFVVNNDTSGDIPDNQKLSVLKSKLLSALRMKKNVGYFIWYLLVGIITTIASTNIVLSQKCAITKSSVDKAYTKFLNTVKK